MVKTFGPEFWCVNAGTGADTGRKIPPASTRLLLDLCPDAGADALGAKWTDFFRASNSAASSAEISFIVGPGPGPESRRWLSLTLILFLGGLGGTSGIVTALDLASHTGFRGVNRIPSCGTFPSAASMKSSPVGHPYKNWRTAGSVISSSIFRAEIAQ
jgi:hypothetical protein